MRKIFSFHCLLVFSLVVLFLLSFSTDALAQATIEDARRTVVRVVVFEEGADPFDDDVISVGSGFVIGVDPPFEYVATNMNLLQPWRVPPGTMVAGAPFPELDRFPVDIYVYRSRDDLVPATIHVPLPEVDMALLRVDPDHLLHDYEPLELASADMVNVNDDVRAIGFPYDAGLGFPLPVNIGLDDFPAAYPSDSTVTDGIISKELTIRGVGYYQTTAAFNPGNNGGPLLNEDNQIIGITSLTTGSDDIHAAFRIDYLTETLRFRGIPYKSAQDVVDEPVVAEEQVSFINLPGSLTAGEEVTLMASVTNNAEEARDLDVSFYANGNLIGSERASQVGPNQSENVTVLWEVDSPGQYNLEVNAGQAFDSAALTSEAAPGIPVWIFAVAAAALLLVILVIILATRSKKPAAVPAAPAAPRPATQPGQATVGPVTRPRPESAPAVTQPRRKEPKPSIKGISGHFAGQSIELKDNQITIGRDPRMVQLVYPQQKEEISRKHLSIRYDDKTQKFNLVDSSSNGTYLSSNQKLEPGQTYYLNSGDRFYLADPKEVFELKVE